MIDHVGFPVSDYVTSKLFYERALAPLGYVLVMEVPVNEMNAPAAGFGIGGEGNVGNPVHVAITARDRGAVDAFHREAIAAGGKDNGVSGLRPHYGPNYYAAFVLDPDGHNIEAVCYMPA
jgi:catechol 2,3-dioxygenase-like lactoylglutathione lyase family enzyme